MSSEQSSGAGVAGVAAPAGGGAPHLPQLDGLRALAACFVVGHHAFLQAWPDGVPDGSAGAFRPAAAWFRHGSYAVDLFIVLSGFCLALPVVRSGGLRGGARGFLTGRFRRIVPTYYAAIALSALLIATLVGLPTGTHWDHSIDLTGRSLLICLLLMSDVADIASINHVFWSIAVEAKIYLLLPLLVAGWRRIGLAASAAIGAALAVAAWLAASKLLPGNYRFLFFVPLFLLGVLAAAVATSGDRRWARLRGLPWGLVCLAGLAAVAGFTAVNSPTDDWGPTVPGGRQIGRFLVGLTSAAGLIALVGRPGRAARLLSTRPLVLVGTFAYSLYLVHAPLLQLIQQSLVFPLGLHRAGQFAALMGLALPLILPAAYAFHLAFERPFLSRRLAAAQARELAAPGPAPAATPQSA